MTPHTTSPSTASCRPSACLAKLLCRTTGMLRSLAPWIGLLFLRVLIGWEFLDSGLEKLNGENWFTDIQDQFPFPFNLLPANVNWLLSMGFEIVGGIALILGLGTRFFALSLLIVTAVATAAVHWPSEWHSLAELWQGYVITDDGHGNFKLPLIFMTMLWPLIFYGAGKISLDALSCRILGKGCQRNAVSDSIPPQ